MRYRCFTLLTGLSMGVLAAPFCRALPVLVSEQGIGANWIVRISNSTSNPTGVDVYAGVVKLTVNGVPIDGFCIDPWQWSVSGEHTYAIVPLLSAPKDPLTGLPTGGIGGVAAHQIEQLWQRYYSPGIDNLTAAALQIKIWEIVDGATSDGTFSLLTNNGTLNTALDGMDTFLATDPGTPAANLIALTSGYTLSHVGQDYVVPSVPDGGATLALVGLGLIAVMAFGCHWRT